MKRRYVKWISILTAGILLLGMTACGGNEEQTDSAAKNDSAETEDIEIGIVVKTATNAHFKDIAYGAVLAGQDLGIRVRVDNTATEADVEGQITKCENMISAGVDAIILTPNDSNGVSGAVEAAHSAGIPFVTMDTEITNIWGEDAAEYMPNFIGEDYEEVAYRLGKAVCEELEGTGNVVILRGMDAASSSQQRTAGMERAIGEYEGITVVESQSANYDQDTAASTMADIIQAHSDIDAVLCCNDLMAVGAVAALEENGIKVGTDGVLVAGLDGNILALESIREGKMYATSYDYSILQGYYAAEQAYDLIQGKDVSEVTLTPDVLITAENVEAHIPHAEEIANWNMGDSIDEVPDFIRDYIEEAKKLAEAS